MEESDKIKLKFEAIWKARDNELNAVRERTLLVWGFIMFCYGGYGYLGHELLNSCKISDPRFSAFNLSLLFLSIVCLRLSLYWVQIAKGAKAWAENMDFIAEGFQHLFARTNESDTVCPFGTEKGRNQSNVLPSVFENKNCANCKGNPTYACVFSVIDPKSKYYCHVDENILTSSSGAFSPAAVVVSIARLSTFISLTLCCIHGGLMFMGRAKARKMLSFEISGWDKWYLPISLITIFLITPLMALAIRKTVVKMKPRLFKCLTDSIMYSGNISMGQHDNQTIRNSFKVAASK